MKLCITAIAALVIAFSSMANAAIIDNGTYTTDTKLGLDYLDVGLVFGYYPDFENGFVYNGRTWALATADQLASTWSDATGLVLTTANIYSSDNDMGAAATKILIDLFDGVTTDVGAGGERVIGDYSIAGYYNFIYDGKLAVHDVWDDSHYESGTDGYRSAWLVSNAAPVPVPPSVLLLAPGLIGLAAIKRRFKK
ncbi:hypothetical protein [Syntrophus gentianae]|nr:hypothetical protein [Syntrophus gentianae]